MAIHKPFSAKGGGRVIINRGDNLNARQKSLKSSGPTDGKRTCKKRGIRELWSRGAPESRHSDGQKTIRTPEGVEETGVEAEYKKNLDPG